jgi:hypothetical protein
MAIRHNRCGSEIVDGEGSSAFAIFKFRCPYGHFSAVSGSWRHGSYGGKAPDLLVVSSSAFGPGTDLGLISISGRWRAISHSPPGASAARRALVRWSKNGVGRLSPHHPSILDARRTKTPSDGGSGAFGGSGPTASRSKTRRCGREQGSHRRSAIRLNSLRRVFRDPRMGWALFGGQPSAHPHSLAAIVRTFARTMGICRTDRTDRCHRVRNYVRFDAEP